MSAAVTREAGARSGLAATPHAAVAPAELSSGTVAGGRLVAIAEELAGPMADLAAAHDRDGTYPFEAIALLQDAGWFRAAVGSDLGGLGVLSIHDLVVAASRLARANPSVAIGANMHTILVQGMEHRRTLARRRGEDRRERAFAASLEAVVRDGLVFAAAQSEAGQDITVPACTATRTADGWRVDGHKVFCTMAPGATHLSVSVRCRGEDGAERYAYALVSADAPGVVVNDDWDALGMRSSGSGSVTFDGVALDAGGVRGGFAAGDAVAYMERNLPSGLFHASASLGIAETADVAARRAMASRGGADGAHARMLVADSAIELTAMRGALARAGRLIDDHRAAEPASDGTAAEIRVLFAEVQAAKAFVNQAAVRVVDRALALSGGAGYTAGHALARAYRDVRAGSFMHPLGANRAHDHLAATALGEVADLH